MFQNPFSFEGRIRRTEYGISMIIYVVVVVILSFFAEAGGSVFMMLGFVPALWFMWAQGAKRCHDRGNSGGWQLIPFYGFWMLFADGDPTTNEYGSDPKGRGDLIENFLVEQL